MNVFLSYSGEDRTLVNKVADQIRPHAQPKYWDQDKEPGKDAWKTIFGWIESAQCLIAIITDKVVKRGESVYQEIGYALAKEKLVIPLVAKDVPSDRLGCLKGVTHISFDPDEPGEALKVIEKHVSKLAQETALQAQKANQREAILTIGLVVLALWAITSE